MRIAPQVVDVDEHSWCPHSGAVRPEPLTVRDAQANYFIDALRVDRIRRKIRHFKAAVIDLDPAPTPNASRWESRRQRVGLFAPRRIPPAFDRAARARTGALLTRV